MSHMTLASTATQWPVIKQLLAPAFFINNSPTTWAEVFGLITGVIGVILAVKQNVWTWPIGNINVAILGILFFLQGLYSDAVLQIFFIVIGFYGWWMWLYGSSQRTELKVQSTPVRQWVYQGIGIALGTVVIFCLLKYGTDSQIPLLDAITTAGSLAATYGQSRKYIESWLVWVVTDTTYLIVYTMKHLYLTTALYLFFILWAVLGYLQWRRELQHVA